jgi:hypothetical protein
MTIDLRAAIEAAASEILIAAAEKRAMLDAINRYGDLRVRAALLDTAPPAPRSDDLVAAIEALRPPVLPPRMTPRTALDGWNYAIRAVLALLDTAPPAPAPLLGEMAVTINMRRPEPIGSDPDNEVNAGDWFPSEDEAVKAAAAIKRFAAPPAPLDVERLTRAMERAMAAVDDEWTIPEFADITVTEYAALARAYATEPDHD